MEPESGGLYARKRVSEWEARKRQERKGESAERGRVPPAVTAARLMSE